MQRISNGLARRASRWRAIRSGLVLLLLSAWAIPGCFDQDARSLLERIGALRNRFVEEATLPRERAAERRPELVAAFEDVRSDVNAFLGRLGHDPADMAYWQDVEGSG